MVKLNVISDLEEFEAFLEMDKRIIVDVRSKADYEHIHLKEAIHLDALKSNVEDFFNSLKRETPILVYCNNGSRSNSVLRLLDLIGFKNLFTLENELFVWLTENTYSA